MFRKPVQMNFFKFWVDFLGWIFFLRTKEFDHDYIRSLKAFSLCVTRFVGSTPFARILFKGPVPLWTGGTCGSMKMLPMDHGLFGIWPLLFRSHCTSIPVMRPAFVLLPHSQGGVATSLMDFRGSCGLSGMFHRSALLAIPHRKSFAAISSVSLMLLRHTNNNVRCHMNHSVKLCSFRHLQARFLTTNREKWWKKRAFVLQGLCTIRIRIRIPTESHSTEHVDTSI